MSEKRTEIEISGDGSMPEVPLQYKNAQELINWLENAETPLDMVETREGRGGHVFHYLKHQYVTETLNKIARFNWDFRVLREWIHDEASEITVLGELTIRVGSQAIVKTQYGSHSIERYSGGQNAGKVISMGDAFKSAASDALKKCASLIGLGLDLSMSVKPNTLKRLHAVGTKTFGNQWDAKRKKAVRCITGGTKTSSKDLTQVEARILIAIIEGDLEAEIVKQAARTLK